MAREFELIRRYFAQTARQFQRSEIVLGIGDDAAVFEVPDRQLVCVSTDVLVAGVHFPADAPADLLGQRALAVNLSDLAAMGAAPLCFSLGLSINEVSEAWLDQFSAGLFRQARQYHCPLIGGDTVCGPLSISITVQGLVDESAVIRRQGATVGDQVLVSGTLGDGALALLAMGLNSHLAGNHSLQPEALSAASRKALLAAYYQPRPRIELARACASLVSCGIDLSDGLAADLTHILEANGLGARINVDALPLSPAACSSADRSLCHAAALFGGDDYELCLCVAPSRLAAVRTVADSLAIPLSCVGEITDSAGLLLHDNAGQPVHFRQSAYAHFAGADQTGS